MGLYRSDRLDGFDRLDGLRQIGIEHGAWGRGKNDLNHHNRP